MKWMYRCAAVLLILTFLVTGCDNTAKHVLPTATPTTAETTVFTTASVSSETTATPTTTTTQAVTTTATEPPPAVNLLDDPDVAAFLDQIASSYQAVGLQVAVVKDGRIAGSHAYGWATKQETPMTVDHKIRIASVSKVIIGMAAMLAVEDGVLDLDADLGQYWNTTVRNPYYPDIPITMRHLLTHTSSITPLYGWHYSSRYDAVRERFAYHYNRTKPGSMSGYVYNNYGFHIAGMTVELATGQHLDDYLRNKLFEPMQIDAAFHSGDINATDMLVTRYEIDGSVVHTVADQLAVHADEMIGGNGTHFSGGLTISAIDLAKLDALLANDGVYEGQRLLSSASVAAMETCMEQTWGDRIYQALPLNYHTDICGRESLYYHSGHAHGVRSMFSYDPAEKDGVVVLMTGAHTDKNSYDFSELAYEMSHYLYDRL